MEEKEDEWIEFTPEGYTGDARHYYKIEGDVMTCRVDVLIDKKPIDALLICLPKSTGEK